MPTLSRDLQAYLSNAISAGIYRDESDALNQAVALLRRRDSLTFDLDEAHEQIDSGIGIDSETVFGRLEEKANRLVKNVPAE